MKSPIRFLAAVLPIAVVTVSAAPIAYYVSPAGNDNNPGTAAAPFASLEAARDALRRTTGRTSEGQTAVPSSWDGAVITLRGGTYYLSRPFTLDGRDSGTSAKPVIYQAAAGEAVTVSGGIRVPGSAWRTVKDPAVARRLPAGAAESARWLDLRDFGIKDPGDIGTPGLRLDLYIDGERMSLARWPNTGWSQVAAGSGSSTFQTTDAHMREWAPSKTRWLHGYWSDGATDWWNALTGFDSATKEARLGGLTPQSGFVPGQWYEAYNVLEELDRPGEWYLDFKRFQIVCIPKQSGAIPDGTLSFVSNVISASGANWIRFSGLTISGSRSHGVIASDTKGFVLDGVQVCNVGGWGIRIEGGSDALINACEVASTGQGGIYLRGGDRATLTPGNHRVVGTQVHDFARVQRTWQPGIQLEGVGLQVTGHCVVEDGPHMGLIFAGNDHVVEDSTFRRIGLEAARGAAIYAGLDWTARGTVIRRNVIEDIEASGLPVTPERSAGILLDKCISGTIVEDNTFTRCGYGVLIDGGRDNRVDGNTFTACPSPIRLNAHLDSTVLDGALNEALEAVPYQSSVWASRYPGLASILDGTAKAPVNNSITGNRALDATWLVEADTAARSYLPMADVNLDSSGVSVALSDLLFGEDQPAGEQPAEDQPAEELSGLVYYVSPSGNDANPGTEQAPFRTLEKARDTLRAATGRTAAPATLPSSWEGATIVLMNGIHRRTAVLTLDGRDSGTPDHPVVITAAAGADVVIDGSVPVSRNRWSLVTATDSLAWNKLPDSSRAGTWKLDLSGLGVAVGSLKNGSDRAELLVGGKLQKLTRYPDYPDPGQIPSWLKVDSIVSGSAGTFNDREDRLGHYTPKDQDILLKCYSKYEWSFGWSLVSGITGSSSYTVALKDFPSGSTKPMSLSSGGTGRYAIYNALEDLSQPGRYVLNASSSVLYYLPPDGNAPEDASISGGYDLIRVDGASHVSFRNLTLRGVQGDAFQLIASNYILLESCNVDGVGGSAIATGGRRHWRGLDLALPERDSLGDGVTDLTVSNCTFSHTGRTGVHATGGRISQLISSNNRIVGCEFSDNGRLDGGPGVNLYGVGFEVSNCTFTDEPIGALSCYAAKSRISGCSFTRCVSEAGDSGAIYSGRNIYGYGTVIENCTFTDIGAWWSDTPPNPVAVGWAVYLDDMAAGITVRDCEFTRCGNGIQVADGHDITITGNRFKDCYRIGGVRHNDNITLANRAGRPDVIAAIDAQLADVDGDGVGVDDEPWASFWPEGAEYLPGGSRYSTRMYARNTVIVDNQAINTTDERKPVEVKPGFEDADVLIEARSDFVERYLALGQVNRSSDGTAMPLRYLYWSP